VPRRVIVVGVAALAAAVGAAGSWANRAGPPLRGTLNATADTLGRVTLSRGGKPVKSIRAGRYKIVVIDRAAHSGFILDRPDFTQIVVTSSPFVGTRTMTVTLTPGSWSFQGAVGVLHDFTVVV
jgi:hypothetical protein